MPARLPRQTRGELLRRPRISGSRPHRRPRRRLQPPRQPLGRRARTPRLTPATSLVRLASRLGRLRALAVLRRGRGRLKESLLVRLTRPLHARPGAHPPRPRRRVRDPKHNAAPAKTGRAPRPLRATPVALTLVTPPLSVAGRMAAARPRTPAL